MKKGSLSLRPDAVGFSYREADVVGSLTVSAVDEKVSEGVLKQKGYFDLMNPGDEVLLQPSPEKPEPVQTRDNRGLLRRLLGIP